MRRVLVCCVVLLLANSAEAKDRGAAPGGYEALYRWCRQMVFRQHGWSEPKPGSPHRLVMSAMEATLMIDDCMRSHGEVR